MNRILVSCLVAVCCFILTEGAGGHWSYEGNTGPKEWCQMSEGCCGKSQSPIALAVNMAKANKTPFVFQNYDQVPASMTLTNNGHSVVVQVAGDSKTRSVSGGGLPATYTFHSFHFHWGSSSQKGSEHTIDGKAYPMELHLVHFNSKYPDLTSAVNSKASDALAVLGVMFDIAANNNPALDNLVKQLSKVTNFGQSTTLTTPFALCSLLPDDTKSFFRYPGSLTTPKCNEAVVWTVFSQSVPVSESQMRAFRSLMTSAKGEPDSKMVDNFRPVQPLEGRTVNLISAQ